MRIKKTPDIPGEHSTMRTTDAYSSIIRSQLQPFGASAGSVAAGWEKEREGSHTARKQDGRMWKKKREREGGVIETDEPPVAVSPVGHSQLTTTIVYTSYTGV